MKIKIRKPFAHSTNEKWTGEYDHLNKKIYCKTFTGIKLPNATSMSVASGITNFSRLVEFKGCAYLGATFFPLPHVNPTSIYSVLVGYVDNSINISTAVDRSGYTAVITIYYTKTTD